MEKVVELRKRTIDILEKTKKDITKYAEERKKVNQYFVDSLQVDNLKEWEEFLKIKKDIERDYYINLRLDFQN